MRDLHSIDLVEAALDDLAAQPAIEIDGPQVVVEHPEIGARLAAPGDPSHRLAQQAAAEAGAAPLGMDMQVVDVGAESRIALGPHRDEAHVARDQHRVVGHHRGELAAPVRPAFVVERGAKRAVA